VCTCNSAGRSFCQRSRLLRCRAIAQAAVYKGCACLQR
jgi:hypothetical protein